jgi:hypothetical protein
MSHELAGGIEPSAYPLLGESASFSDSPPSFIRVNSRTIYSLFGTPDFSQMGKFSLYFFLVGQ